MAQALIIGGTRLPREHELALNILLERKYSFQGCAMFRVTWAADDAKGLAKRHGLGCPKVNPMDWACGCPLENPDTLPFCVHENQMSYHLLVRETLEREGGWACIMHFLDPKTQRPVNPTAAVLEVICPMLWQAQEAKFAVEMGNRAVAEHRMTARRIDIEFEERKKQQKVREEDEEMIRRATYIGFDGNVKPVPPKELVCQ